MICDDTVYSLLNLNMKRLILIAVTALLMIPLAGAQTAQKINKSNLVVKEWNTDPKSGKKVLDHVTTFSPEGRKIDEVEYSSTAQKWHKRYEWGANGKIARELLYDERNRLVNYKTFEYNEFGRKKLQNTYDAKGKLISIKTFEYITEDE